MGWLSVSVLLASLTRKPPLPPRIHPFSSPLPPPTLLPPRYAGTFGMREGIEYIVSDPIASPLDRYAYYAEKLAIIPTCFHPMHQALEYGSSTDDTDDVSRESSDVAPTSHTYPSREPRETYGIPHDASFVFCDFNAHFKFDPATFHMWMRILTRVPGSVLWLQRDKSDLKEVRANLAREARARGVDAARVVFLNGWLPADEHLIAKSHCDLFLDTLHYNAHVTAADAIWAGVPVLTMPGEAMASRLGASIAVASGNGAMVVWQQGKEGGDGGEGMEGVAAYEERAVELATNATAMAAAKASAVAARASPLYRLSAKVREVETAFLMMAELKRAGVGPYHLLLAEEPEAAGQAAEEAAREGRGGDGDAADRIPQPMRDEL